MGRASDVLIAQQRAAELVRATDSTDGVRVAAETPMRAVTCSALAVLVLAPLPARAQEKNTFAVGLNYTQRLADDHDAHGNGGVGLSWRIGHSTEGWGWTYGLGWFVTDLERSIGGRQFHFGEVKVRPIVGGYGYTYRMSDRWYITGDIVGGMAFTTFSLTPEATDALLVEAGAQSIDTHIGMIPTVRPEVRTWYDFREKWGVTVGAWYAIARPTVTMTTPTSREELHIRADTFSLSGGVVYRIR